MRSKWGWLVAAVIAAMVGVWLAGCGGDSEGGSGQQSFQTYDQAVVHYTSTYHGEPLDRGYSQAISNAMYYTASGEGVMTLQFSKTPDKTYIFKGVPPDVWNGLKSAANKGGYYNSNIAHRFTFPLTP